MGTLHLCSFLAVIALGSCSVVQLPGDQTFELLILHNNDMHARFEQTSQLSGICTTADRDAGKCYGGFPRVAYVVKEARQAAATGQGPPVLYLNAGDTYTGTAWFTIYKWKIAADFINALQPDAVSLGNHEFDNEVDGLLPFIETLTCPVLAANLDLSRVPALALELNLMDSVIFDVGGTKVGVIGYLTPETKTLAIRNDVQYIEEKIAIKREVAKLKDKGVKILIALGHSGFQKDLDIAQNVEDIDLVIGGHTNTFLWNGTTPDVEASEGPYPYLVKQKSGRLVPVVQAYAYTKYLGRLHITFNSDGEIVKFDGNPILLNNSIPQDPAVLEIVNRYRGDVNKLSNVVIGNTSVNLDGHSCKRNECNLGNLITDAMVSKYAFEYTGDGWTDAPIAITQAGSIRTSIVLINLPGNITYGHLVTVMPFSDILMKVTVTGTVIKNMLEHSVALYTKFKAPAQFLQMSGMKVEYDFDQLPGRRVHKVMILCGKCLIPRYSPLNETAEYNIIMPSFLYDGGDGYDVFDGLPVSPLSFDQVEASSFFLRRHSPVHSAVDGRINILNFDKFMNSGTNSKYPNVIYTALSLLLVLGLMY